MAPPQLPFVEPLARLTQANLATWTQFWMSPDQPWSPTRQDLFGRAPGASPNASIEAFSKLWSGLVENQNRFLAEVSQRGASLWQSVPRMAQDTAREAAASGAA